MASFLDRLECRICGRERALPDMTQLWPCMHMFCTDCIQAHRFFSKCCPAEDCFIPLQAADDAKWNACENQMCLRRITQPMEIYKLSACQHEICAYCYTESSGREPSVCPLDGCGAPLGEDDDGDCDGACKKHYEAEKLITTNCCRARICQTCFARMHGFQEMPTDPKLLNFRDPRCKGKCVERTESQKKKPKNAKTSAVLSKCMGYLDCKGEALRNFPSEQECEHEVCINCLDKAIKECTTNDSLPMCPNDQCRLPYRFESVTALKALLPQHAQYFNSLALDMTQGYESLRDDSVTWIDLFTAEEVKSLQVEVRCSISEEDEAGPTVVVFNKSGILGELIREVRRALRILPTDKVYGYFVRREDGDDQQLLVNQANCKRPVAEFQLDLDCHLILDVTGIVMTKKQKMEGSKTKGKKAET